MRILIVSVFFPPFASIGSTRVGKTAKWLREFGHDVRVLTCKDHALPETAPLEIPPENVLYAAAFNLHRPSELIQGGRASYVERGGRKSGFVWDVLYKIWTLYKTIVYVPDQFITWVPFAIRAGRRLAKDWRPDVILASGPPPSAYLVGRALSRSLGIPWLADLRDPWTDNATYTYTGVRRAGETWLERRVLRSASALVTVTEPWADILGAKSPRPVHVIYNGYDEEDLPADVDKPAGVGGLEILFTGTYYVDLYNITALLEAVSDFQSPDCPVRLTMVGNMVDHALAEARRWRRESLIDALLPVSRNEAMVMQARADVLLLLNATGDYGLQWIPAKLFEYLASRRPILAITPHDSAVGQLIERLNAGRVATTAAEIRESLQEWLRVKREAGSIPSLPRERAAEFARPVQVKKLADALERVGANDPVNLG